MDITLYIQRVRALLGDDDAADYTFTDAQITTLQGMYESPYGAAISLLERVAVTEALLHKYVKSYDMTIDGSKAAEIVMKRANGLRKEQADLLLEDSFGAFAIVDVTPNPAMEYGEAWDFTNRY